MILDALGLAPAPGVRWPRRVVGEDAWQAAAQGLAEGRWTLAALWGDEGQVHMALIAGSGTAILSLACPEGRFPSVARIHAPASLLERAMCDLFGFEAEGAPDPRPWLDHGRWDLAHPLGAAAPARAAEPYAFLPAEGEGLHQIPVGPVHAGIIEPGHFRFHAYGETIVRLEARLGYTHKGTETLMRGATLDRAADLAGRVSGDSTVAYALAFAMAAENAAGVTVPPRAVWLRALVAELERLANHLGDIGAVCNDAAFPLLLAHCGILREEVLRTAAAAFGHRLMRDVVRPGGVARDLDDAGAAAIRALLEKVEARFPAIVRCYDETASLQDRTVGTGLLAPERAARFGVGGFVGRASGRDFDARRALPFAPYDDLAFEVPVLQEGDVNARVWIRIREVEQSLVLLHALLESLPEGELLVPLAPGAGEGAAMVEGFRGDVFAWMRIGEDGRVARCHLRDPSWFQWPLLECAVEGNIVADFPLCNKSFNCSYSGCDL